MTKSTINQKINFPKYQQKGSVEVPKPDKIMILISGIKNKGNNLSWIMTQSLR